ncbi:hypothetical protein PaeCFBP13512_23195 [Paenibacillus sp. CFBP13512]|uniref:hypothetical protein n=1 Tax=Paenibacillus sp. CFBP13512 TaxID=2184007 RepID=UPI0010BFD57C|nr:hypothetical protein [Paenibacillus sp. CFBP13512]TKJ83061.1 hypothetical protein PaeCFBP13512_23195 [Paenibacillus sp. CFBP13512]
MKISKLSELVDQYALELYVVKKEISKQYPINKEQIDQIIVDEMQKYFTSFHSVQINEIKPLIDLYKDQENDQLKSIILQQATGLNISINDQKKLDLISISIQLLDNVLFYKREYQKQFSSHIFEKNLLASGAFLSGTPHAKTMSKLVVSENIFELERRGFRPIVYRNDKGAILNTYDTKVLIGLFKLWMIQGCNKNIEFEFKELAEAMLTKPSGGEYKLIYDSLQNIAATWIEYKEYYDQSKHKYYSATVKHRPITSLKLIARKREEENGKERAAEIVFHDILHQSLLARNYVFINMVIFNELPTSYARMIYLSILNGIENDNRLFNIDQLIDQIIITDENYNRARTINTIKNSFEHLLQADIIADYEFVKVKNKVTFIQYNPAEWLLVHRQSQLENHDS